MKTKIYVHASKESMYDKGEELGLSGEALNMFSYTGNEIELTIDVNTGTGLSTITEVDGKPIVDKSGLSKDDITLVSQVMEEKGVWSHKYQAWNRLEAFLIRILGR